jgi:hypothetical protein
MSDLQQTWCFAQPNQHGNYYRENSLDGQSFRSPIFAPMNGCAKGQALPAGECRTPQLKGCSTDPWGWTAGRQGCMNSTLCSPVTSPQSEFSCSQGVCRTLPNQTVGCQAPAFRKTFAGNVVKTNFNLPTFQSLDYRLPASEIPKSEPSTWTVNRNIVLIRTQKPGFDLTMYAL